MICLTRIALDAMRVRTRPCDAMQRTRGQQRTLTPRLIVVGSRSLIRARERFSRFLCFSRKYRQDRIVASQKFNVKYQLRHTASLRPNPSIRPHLYISNSFPPFHKV